MPSRSVTTMAASSWSMTELSVCAKATFQPFVVSGWRPPHPSARPPCPVIMRQIPLDRARAARWSEGHPCCSGSGCHTTRGSMGEVAGYLSGTFCWVDLGTRDLEASRAFYRRLFGWEMEEVPVPSSSPYLLCRVEGRDVAGIHEHTEDASAWMSSISVDDVDSTSSRARDLGADVLREPFEVTNEGREAILRDPVGAVMSMWQPGRHMGASMVNEVNTWGWNELSTNEFDQARSFYTELFGWTTEDTPGPLRRGAFTMGRLLIGGIHEAQPGEGDE